MRIDRNYPLLILLNLSLLLYKTGDFLTAHELAGRDLVGAYSLVETFQIGWSTDWFLGFPMFYFYPPGFFGTTSFLGRFIGEQIAFKLAVYLSLIAIPLTVYYCFRTLFNKEIGLVSGFLGIFIIFLREPFSLVYQTLQVGLVAQAAALPLLFVFIPLLWKNSRGSAYLSSLILGAIIIIHPYVGVLAVFYLIIYSVISRNLFRTLIASLGLAMTGWWWTRVLENSWYMQSYIGPTGQLVNWPWLFIPFLALDRSREGLSLVILGAASLVVGTVSIGPQVQHYRFFIYGQILLVLAAAPGLYRAVEKLDERLVKTSERLLVVLVGLSILVPVLGVDIEPDWRSDTELEGVIPDEGRMVVETSHNDLHESYVPIQTAPLRSNISVVNGLYADGSISSPYLLGLEKEIAGEPVPNPLAVQANLTEEQIKQRMAYFGIGYALIRTDHAREKLGFMDIEAENKDFRLLSWEPVYDRETKSAKICMDRPEWDELNQYIFRTDLPSVIPVLDCEEGKKINLSGPESVIEQVEDENIGQVNLSRESITPGNTHEAMFHLRVD